MELQSGLVRVASYRRKLPRKKKNIYLPTEVWVDVFCYPWTTRPRMAQMVDKIGNRWFGEQLQFYLHEWGKHSFGELYFKPQGVINYPNDQYKRLEYPQMAMPENIKFSKYFQIDYFDNRVFNFFRRIQSLLTANTKLEIRFVKEQYSTDESLDSKNLAYQLDNVRFILGHLLPFIDGIHTLQTDDRMLHIVQSFTPEKFHQIKMLTVHLDRPVQSESEAIIMEWLTTSNNNEPKLLRLFVMNDITQQQFMKATEPAIFAVIFNFGYNLLEFNCENGIGEQLCGMRNENSHGGFTVFRHQANAKVGEQLRQWVDEKMDERGEFHGNQCIRLSRPTIGLGNIFSMPDLDEDEADEKQEDDEKPSTSKKTICE